MQFCRWLLLGVTLFTVVAHRATAADYTILDLGTFGGDVSAAYDLNDRGQVTGWAALRKNTTAHAFRYSKGKMLDLGTLAGSASYGYGISPSGLVTGAADTRNNENLDLFLYAHGRMRDYGATGIPLYCHSHDVNDHGVAVGSARDENYRFHAWKCERGVFTDLGSFGGIGGEAFAINNAGQIAGYAYTADNIFHAFVTVNGVLTDLGTLAGIGGSYAYGINDDGVVVGASLTANYGVHAFSYANGTMTDLGSLGGYVSVAYQSNSNGQVVGYSSTLGGTGYSPFLYANGAMVDLHTLLPEDSGWDLRTNLSIQDVGNLIAINNRGQIAGTGMHNGVQRGFLMTPTQSGSGVILPEVPRLAEPLATIASPAIDAVESTAQTLSQRFTGKSLAKGQE